MNYEVEGRYFTGFRQAFTFASGQAEKMGRSVDVNRMGIRLRWCATAHPPGYVQESKNDHRLVGSA